MRCSVLRVFDASTYAPLTSSIQASQFFYGKPQLLRDGPYAGFAPVIMNDPSCLYDTKSKRWFHTFDMYTGGEFTGVQTDRTDSFVSLAVSESDDPRGAWKFYDIPMQNDGTQVLAKNDDVRAAAVQMQSCHAVIKINMGLHTCTHVRLLSESLQGKEELHAIAMSSRHVSGGVVSLPWGHVHVAHVAHVACMLGGSLPGGHMACMLGSSLCVCVCVCVCVCG
jgi:hypothetical protein